MKNKKADISLIRKYLNGELDARAMYELERQAQDDPALMDMIQGVESSSQEVDDANLIAISQMIRRRAEERKPDKVISLPESGRHRIQWKVWIAAASLILISAVGALLWVEHPEHQQVVQDQPVVQDHQVIQDQQLVKEQSKAGPKNKAEADTVPVISEAVPGIKTDVVLLSRKKINPVAAPKPGLTVPDAVIEQDSEATIRARRDSSMIASANVELAKARNNNEVRALQEVAIVANLPKKKVTTTASVTTLSGKIAGVSVDSKSDNSMKVIRGVVTDKITNEPLPGAAVLIKGEKGGINTDVNGRFVLYVPSKTSTLLVSVIGYEQQQVKLGKNDNIDITMSPDMQALSEVVVVAYGTKHSEKAYPVIGWPAYKKYLEDNAVLGDGKKGKVTIAFRIDAEGKPSQIRIVKGAAADLNQKATSLIENGSRWIRGRADSTEEVALKIKFQ